MYIRCARCCTASRFIVKATTAVRSAVCAESVRMCRCWNLPCCFRSGGAYSAAAVCKQRGFMSFITGRPACCIPAGRTAAAFWMRRSSACCRRSGRSLLHDTRFSWIRIPILSSQPTAASCCCAARKAFTRFRDFCQELSCFSYGRRKYSEIFRRAL